MLLSPSAPLDCHFCPAVRLAQFDLLVFVVYTTDEVGWNLYLDALASSFPRVCIGSPLEDLQVDVDAFTRSVAGSPMLETSSPDAAAQSSTPDEVFSSRSK